MGARKRVAREAARLLYLKYVQEYKQAKEQASKNLGIATIPSNYEVALELDILADEVEGWRRKEMLLEMRKIALEIMRVLEDRDPILIGSVWRGVARKGSDIDLRVYSNELDDIINLLSKKFEIINVEKEQYLLSGKSIVNHHIKLEKGNYLVEIVVKHPKDRSQERCEIYRDLKKGLDLEELVKLIEIDPFRRFVPRRYRR
jgi:predicted nucleotidyltransferase